MIKKDPPSLLESIHSPLDLRHLPERQLAPLAAELRAYLVRSVAGCGGHFAAGLGTVELTIALHYVFDTPEDRLVWDVGHQCYPHKILTGRRDRLPTIRRKGGLSGFLRREESPYDAFGAGHSSTSISAALGMALASRAMGADRQVVAIIGDGGMTAGLAYEALNHAGSLDVDLLVVLNDNEMSISPNVGALSHYLARLLSSRTYATVKKGGRKVLEAMPAMWDLAQRAEKQLKTMVVPGALFEELGFSYFGPVDGHDLNALVQVLRNLRALPGRRLLHVVTRKGKGYPPAEADPVKYHGVVPFDPAVGLGTGGSKGAATYTSVFGDWLCEMAARDPRLVAITPAMREGSGLVRFSKEFPGRYFDAGIAEQHSVTLAAGLACEGMKPVVAIYSTFLQRAYDQLIHDVVIQKLPVLFAIDRAGLVGPDGPTHHGSYDLTYLNCLPGMVIMTPADENELRHMLYTGFLHDGPAAVRYPRANATGVGLDVEMKPLPIGRAEVRREGRQVAFLVFGTLLGSVSPLAEAMDATLINMRFVKPLDEAAVLAAAEGHALVVTLEENAIAGGAGSAVNECLARHGVQTRVLNLGLPDRFIEHASREEALADAGLEPASIATAVTRRLQRDWAAGRVCGALGRDVA
ncbi:1-deoxy-D-xylulose-5-phosphate synthase [Pelomicrobium sp. G1]|uniref:1-deoxy-D-xylulose-5-phosphate synthase n=1 Tax=unclassified Pelomicrobium TaxID=2815318 RepID=UPI003F76F24A